MTPRWFASFPIRKPSTSSIVERDMLLKSSFRWVDVLIKDMAPSITFAEDSAFTWADATPEKSSPLNVVTEIYNVEILSQSEASLRSEAAVCCSSISIVDRMASTEHLRWSMAVRHPRRSDRVYLKHSGEEFVAGTGGAPTTALSRDLNSS
jgi:hypothetical protein